MDWFEEFEAAHHSVNGIRIFARTGGPADAPPVLLLHGFPQTHVMWRRVAAELAARFRVVMADLRGYGDSDAPADDPRHASYSKRVMAADAVELMRILGHERFQLVGHDRGGRVAHRLALDWPQTVSRLCVIDIAPTLEMYDATDMRFARAYYHWFHLIQPAPLPERMIGGDPGFYLRATLGGWGSQGADFMEPQAVAEYERCFCRPVAIHAVCEDYRASAGIDLEHDRESRASGQKITCDLLVLWGERGVIQALFDPLALWSAQCSGPVSGRPLAAGHFIPEERPAETAQALLDFLGPALPPTRS